MGRPKIVFVDGKPVEITEEESTENVSLKEIELQAEEEEDFIEENTIDIPDLEVGFVVGIKANEDGEPGTELFLETIGENPSMIQILGLATWAIDRFKNGRAEDQTKQMTVGIAQRQEALIIELGKKVVGLQQMILQTNQIKV